MVLQPGGLKSRMLVDPVFFLKCVDCESRGELSRLWIRASIQLESPRTSKLLHYVECMNCGVHLKSRHRDFMESVGDEEWNRFVSEDAKLDTTRPPGRVGLA
jgi:hypothetical protein